MKENKEIEKILLDDSTYNDVVKSKIEHEFKLELESAKKSTKNKYLTNIKDVPKSKLFTKDAIFEVINKSSKTKSYINGLQAEGYIGTQNADRAKLLSGQIDSFVNGNHYVKFIKVKV